MNVNRGFVKSNPKAWTQIQSDHLKFSKNRASWRRQLYRSRVKSKFTLQVGMALIDKFGGINAENLEGKVYPEYETIAKEIGLEIKQVQCGVDELRALGLVVTRRSKSGGSLRFFFSDPDFIASVHNSHGEEVHNSITVDVHNSGTAEVHNSRGEEVSNKNMTNEPDSGEHDPVMPSGPTAYGPADISANAPIVPNDVRNAAVSVVEDGGRQKGIENGEIDPDDVPIPLPATYGPQSLFLAEITGKRNKIAADEILAWWNEHKSITRRIARQIFEKCELERMAS